MTKKISIKLEYHSQISVTNKQLNYIQFLLEENGYGDAYNIHITKYNQKNPFKRINAFNANKLINALKNNNRIVFIDKL